MSPTLARAESAVPPDTGPPCGYFGADEVLPASGDVPANWPRFLVGLAGDYETDARIVRVSDGSTIEIATYREHGGLVVMPAAPLVVGEEYDLHHPTCEGVVPGITRYRAIDPIAEPTSLGSMRLRLVAGNHVQGPAHRMYYAIVELDPDPSALAWEEALRWGARASDSSVDASSQRLPLERALQIGVSCGATTGLAEGDVVLRAVSGPTASPTDPSLVSGPDQTFTIDCDEAERVDLATLEPLTPDQIEYWDTVPMDASTPIDVDAGTGNVDGGRMGMDTEPDTDSSCSVGHGRGAPLAALFLALAAVATASRRTRSTRWYACDAD